MWLPLSLDGTKHTHSSACVLSSMPRYEEVVQLLPDYLNLGVDFAYLPKVLAWCDRMRALPMHDEAHVALTALGDLRTPNDVPLPKRLGVATKEAIKALAKAQESF
mmetsp:Transcript_37696/g.99630  ORF Transcript_37696/g.99630 Transcript_37696/m.99630 type:complete len:106 (-) Transcript_37696:193-510(-)